MALETLKGVKEIGGFKVAIMDELREQYPDKFNASGSMNYEWFEKEIRPTHFIQVRNDKNSISFTIQNGPVKEHGVNGCQVETLLHATVQIISGLNAKFPSKYNTATLQLLGEAIRYQDQRKKEREARGVEGTSQA